MATAYQTSYTSARTTGTAIQKEVAIKNLERQFHEARNIVASGATSYQTSFATIRGESGVQREIDLSTTERQLAEARN